MEEQKYKHWAAKIKEHGNDNILTPTYWGYVDKKYLIDFWGLNDPDVEWYEIYEEDDNEQ